MARRDLYRFLAGLFLKCPGDDAVRELLRNETLEEIAHVYGTPAVAGLRELEVDPALAGGEFERLFRVPVAGFVPACESVYRVAGPKRGREGGCLYGPSCREVSELMKEAGAEIPTELRHPPDHIGIELLFLSYLCDQAAVARDQGDPDRLERWLGRELRFLRDHPSVWIGRFSERVRSSLPDGFYAGVTRLVEEVLSTDLRLLRGT